VVVKDSSGVFASATTPTIMELIMTRKLLLLTAALAMSCASHNDPYANLSGPGEFDRTFMSRASESGAAEVQLGQLAQEHGEREDIRKFARRMIADHNRVNDELAQLARMKGVPLPDGAGHDGQSQLNMLETKSAGDFDRAYAKTMVEDHVKDVAEFTEAAEKAHDKDIRRFASQTLPTLQEHLRMARDLQPK
jgi:putative membrane protein